MLPAIRFIVVLVALLPIAALADATGAPGGPSASPAPAAGGTGDIVQQACAGDNPYFAAARVAPDEALPAEVDPAVLAFGDTADDDPTAQLMLATRGQVGAVYGLAYDWRRGHVYVGAFHRAGAPYGPGGPGAIYRLIPAIGVVEPWASLDAGPDRHGPDESAWVGRSGLGALAVDESGTLLFAVDLADGRVHRLSLPDGRDAGSFAHGAADEPWAADARPFAVTVHGGNVYHAVVDSRASRPETGAPTAHVFRTGPNGASPVEVLSFELGYRDAPAWRAWSDDPAAGPQPVLAEIAFRTVGWPILGLRDRAADMAPAWSGAPALVGHGDVLPVEVESDRWVVLTDPERYRDRFRADEALWGAVATYPSLDVFVATAASPLRPSSAGAVWYLGGAGDLVAAETLAAAGPDSPVARQGLGDLASLCGPPGAPTLVPSPTATATATATPSATPTSSATATPSSTPTPSPTPAPVPIYVPIALDVPCARVPLEVALVLDLSTSMRQPTRDGRPKVDAAIAAATAFVELVVPGGSDRAAVVGFHDRAWTAWGLDGDLDALRAALSGLAEATAPHTRLDLAVAEGVRAVGDGAREGALRVVVILTDGRPSGVPPAEDGKVETTVLRAGDAARAAGVRLFTIGVGAEGDVDGELLARLAGTDSAYLYTPDAEDLRAVYTELATTVRCPPPRHDWSRSWP